PSTILCRRSPWPRPRSRCSSFPGLFFSCYPAPRDLHSFPTRRSSDLTSPGFPPPWSPSTSRAPRQRGPRLCGCAAGSPPPSLRRSEEHTSELQSPCNLVCRLLLEKKKVLTFKSTEQTVIGGHPVITAV